jgi:hypothetical protein
MTSPRSLADLIALVPYLLGFHPSNSMVVLSLRNQKIIFQVRADLPTSTELPHFVGYYTDLVARHRSAAVVLLGYGIGPRVTPVALALRSAIEARGIPVVEAVRIAEGRFWSYLCTRPGCCPTEGRPYDAISAPIATAAIVEGCVALPSRTMLERRFTPVEGPDRQGMREATGRADRRLADLMASKPDDPGKLVRSAGVVAVDTAVARQRADGRLTDDELAWLSVVLVHLPVRDYAWQSIGGDLIVHIGLWTELLRRSEPDLSVAPATLLGFAAWLAGEGVIAGIAVSRALDVDPTYRMAQLLDAALAGGIAPAEWAEAQGRPLAIARRRSSRRRPVRA